MQIYYENQPQLEHLPHVQKYFETEENIFLRFPTDKTFINW